MPFAIGNGYVNLAGSVSRNGDLDSIAVFDGVVGFIDAESNCSDIAVIELGDTIANVGWVEYAGFAVIGV